MNRRDTLKLLALALGSAAIPDAIFYLRLHLYAPGYASPTGLNLQQMEDLTGFQFRRIDQSFGVQEEHFPRFALNADDSSATVLG